VRVLKLRCSRLPWINGPKTQWTIITRRVSEGFCLTLRKTQKHDPSLTQRVGIVADPQLQNVRQQVAGVQPPLLKGTAVPSEHQILSCKLRRGCFEGCHWPTAMRKREAMNVSSSGAVGVDSDQSTADRCISRDRCMNALNYDGRKVSRIQSL